MSELLLLARRASRPLAAASSAFLARARSTNGNLPLISPYHLPRFLLYATPTSPLLRHNWAHRRLLEREVAATDSTVRSLKEEAAAQAAVVSEMKAQIAALGAEEDDVTAQAAAVENEIETIEKRMAQQALDFSSATQALEELRAAEAELQREKDRFNKLGNTNSSHTHATKAAHKETEELRKKMELWQGEIQFETEKIRLEAEKTKSLRRDRDAVQAVLTGKRRLHVRRIKPQLWESTPPSCDRLTTKLHLRACFIFFIFFYFKKGKTNRPLSPLRPIPLHPIPCLSLDQ